MPILTLLTSAFGNERYNAAAMPDELGQVRVIPVLQDEGVAFPGESRASWAMTRWPGPISSQDRGRPSAAGRPLPFLLRAASRILPPTRRRPDGASLPRFHAASVGFFASVAGIPKRTP
jgi:hypothetical protein